MAAPKENLLSLGHLTGMKRNTFTKQREPSLKKRPVLLQADLSTLQSHQHLRATHLLQRRQELKERELTARRHNRQLLQQFEEAQDTLREMLTLTTAMKTIRMEYERYLEEKYPYWQQQLKEKTQAAQKKKMEEYLKSCLKNTEDRGTKSSADRPLLSQGSTTKPQEIAATQEHYHQNSPYNQDGSPHPPYMQSSWQTHPQSQMARCPIRAPFQPQGSSHVPPPFLSPPIFTHPFQLHHITSMPSHHHPWPRQNPPGRASPHPDYPWSWTAGAAGFISGSEALWGQLYKEESPPERGEVQVVGEEAETTGGERGGGSRSGHSSQELDIKPVRLSSGPAESSESSRESSQASSEKRKKREKRGRVRRSSSDRERRSSQESSKTSSAVINAAATAAQSSESDISSEKSRTSTSRRRRRNEGLPDGSQRAEMVAKEKTRNNRDDSGSQKEESHSAGEETRSEKAGEQSPGDKSESCREESGSQREHDLGSVRIKTENEGGDLSSSSEKSNVGEMDEEEKEHEKDLGEGDEEEDDGDKNEDSQRDEEQEDRDVEADDVTEGKNTTDEEEETGAEEEVEQQESEEEMSDGLKKGENGKQGTASSQDEEVDEDESEGGEDKMEEDGESDEEDEGGHEEEEEQRQDETGESEEKDSEDSIISPQIKSKKLHVIPEETREDEDEKEGNKTGSSDDDAHESSDEDIEHLLAPQEQVQKKEEKDLKAAEKPKVVCDMVMDISTKMDHPSDSEEFDHFYD